MAVFNPFKAFRPLNDLAAQIAAKPYDVLNSDEAREEVKDNPLSFLHVGKPEIDLDPNINPYDASVYKKGKENLEKLIASGHLKQDHEAYYYLYSLTMDGRTQNGLVGCASVDDYWNDNIKKHEKTRKSKEEDRCEHVRVTRAQTGPIFLTYRDVSDINLLINKIKQEPPEVDFVSPDAVRNQCWIIKDHNDIKFIKERLAEVPAFYVADGHHRSAAAAIVGKECQEANPNHTGDEEYNFFLSVLFPASELFIMDYNRLVKDLNGHSMKEFFDLLSRHFTIEIANTQYKPKEKGEFGLYIENNWYKLKARPELFEIDDPVESLDVAILQKYVLSDILGIDDPRTSDRIDFVGGIRGLNELERRVNSGEMLLAISMYPTSIEELMNIADAGQVMPPKSTWFEPKLKDGLYIHFY